MMDRLRREHIVLTWLLVGVVALGMVGIGLMRNSADHPQTVHKPSVHYPLVGTKHPINVKLPNGPKGQWDLVFDDEFNGKKLDTKKWQAVDGPGAVNSDPGRKRIHEEDLQGPGVLNNVIPHASNVSQWGGLLRLQLSSKKDGAEVSSAQSYMLPVGSVAEARVRFPGGPGETYYNWPAWWTSSNDWPAGGENDIAEVFANHMIVGYHSNSGSHTSPTIPGTWSQKFHVFTLVRLKTSVEVFWDSTLVAVHQTDDNGSPQALLVNIGVPNSGVFHLGPKAELKVDYVRAWKPRT